MVSLMARPSVAAALVFAAALGLIMGSAPVWCLCVGFSAVAWRILVARGRLVRPKRRTGMRFLLGAITALLVVAVAVSFRTLSGLGAGTALLVVMGALKVLESRARRDDAIVIGVALFLLLAAGLAGQALWRLPLYLLTLWGACAAMALVAHSDALFGVRAALRLAARALLMSIPLAVVCFAFFPRIAGQFWTLQGEAATTGLSDEMSPGSIGRLAISYDLAFRVRFAAAPPAHASLYWRGLVLNSFDGFTWRRESYQYIAAPPRMQGDPIRYRVSLEPTNQPWLFALDTVAESPRPDVALNRDSMLVSVAQAPITSTTSYDATSYLRTEPGAPLTAGGRAYETRLPRDRNPRTLALADQMRARSASDSDYARRVLAWFRDTGLEYTLEPGTTTVDSVDTTLFDSKRGFCGHFASAYATMMRAAGIPARVVTGYLGGEWNPVGGYFIVRQSDAHAWDEIWLDGRGWVRIDPTAVVAPERLQRGVYEMLGASLPAGSALLHGNRWFNKLSLLWDGASQWWQGHVVEFDLRAQFNLLEKLGIDSPEWQHLGWGFAIGLTTWVAWVALSLRRSVARGRPDRVGRAWLRATRKLKGIAPRAAYEGPVDYARRVAAARPDLAPRVTELAARYSRLRFGPAADRDEIAAFEREVSRLAV
jgi:transglutaminase-like putative cysteine protease